MAKILHVVK